MLYFARHGETVAGKEERFEGFSDSQLTEKGDKQAGLLGEHFKDKKISKIFVSPRKRAVATAEIAARTMHTMFEIDDRLKEVCYGSWETKSRMQLKSLALWKKRDEDFYHFIHPGFYQTFPGESYEQLYLRLVPVFSELKSQNESILIIAHSGVLRCARKFFEKIDDEAFKQSKFENSVFFSVKKEGNEFITSLFDVMQNRII